MDAREMAPRAWATEMQLATKTMLRSVNKQRLGRVKRPRKLKDALALESSPRDVKRASKLAGLLGLGRRRDRHSQVERAPEKPADFDEKKWPLCSQSIIERKRPKGSLPLLKGACVDDDSILQNVDLAKTTAQHRLARAIKRDVARHGSASAATRPKYFCEGQRVEKELQAKIDEGTLSWTEKWRKQLAMAVPFLLVHIVWWTAMIRWNSWHKFTDRIAQQQRFRKVLPNGKSIRTMHSNVRPWYMSVTMIFGSMVAGATSEGGASIAFPVMTLAMDVKPHVAKQFSFMIQSVGMTAAAFVILYMQVRVDWKSITYCSLGGAFGVIFGLEQVAPTLTPPYAKMYFVCWAGSFAASLYFLNRIHGRKVYLVVDPKHLPEIWAMGDLTPYWQLNLLLNWKAMILLGAGFIGGIFTSIAGSGIDICSFSVLTLLFRVSEKTATPTSVVLMAINTFLAMCYCKWMMREGLEQLAWEFFCVCAPIVVVGAPLGSVLGSYVHRLVLAAFVYATDFVQLIGALIVVQPWSREKCTKELAPAKEMALGPDTCNPTHLCWSSAAIFICGLVAFWVMQWAGEKLIQKNTATEKEVAEREKLKSAEDVGDVA